MIAIELKADGFTVAFNRQLETAKRPRAVLVAVGQEAKNQLKSHFLAKDRNEPNKLGGPRQHYWNRVRDSVQNPVLEQEDTQVRISITEPTFAQKYFGGRIAAKRAKMLTIPQTPEAYGRTAETFEHETGLKLFVVSPDHGAFAGLAAKFASGGIVVEYIFKPFVNQKADPTALPSMADGSDFNNALIARGQAVVDRQNAQANSSEGIEG